MNFTENLLSRRGNLIILRWVGSIIIFIKGEPIEKAITALYD